MQTAGYYPALEMKTVLEFTTMWLKIIIVLNGINNPSTKRQMHPFSTLSNVQKLKRKFQKLKAEWLPETRGWLAGDFKGCVPHTGGRRSLENILYSMEKAINNSIWCAF